MSQRHGDLVLLPGSSQTKQATIRRLPPDQHRRVRIAQYVPHGASLRWPDRLPHSPLQ